MEDEFLKQYTFANYKKTNERKYRKVDAKRADEFIKHCPKCRRCWELDRFKQNNKLMLYDIFPTYGKQKEVCPVCSN